MAATPQITEAARAGFPHPGHATVHEPRLRRLTEPLTQREMQVLTLVCDGASNQEIAQHMQIALSTVKWHLLQVFRKLGTERRTQAVAVAVHLKLVEPTWLPGLPEPY